MSTDRLPTFCRARILILGVGNVLFGDDGYGPAVVEHLDRHYLIPDDVYLMDVGTGARRLLFTLSLGEARPEEILIIDAVGWGRAPGHLSEVAAGDLPLTKVDDFSLHQVPTSNLLRELTEGGGTEVTVVACDVGEVPREIAPGLSPRVQRAVECASQRIARRYGFLRRPTLAEDLP